LDDITADTLDGRTLEIPLGNVSSRWFDYRGLLHTLIHNSQRGFINQYEIKEKLLFQSYTDANRKGITRHTGYAGVSKFTGVPEHDVQFKFAPGQVAYADKIAHQLLKNPKSEPEIEGED